MHIIKQDYLFCQFRTEFENSIIAIIEFLLSFNSTVITAEFEL